MAEKEKNRIVLMNFSGIYQQEHFHEGEEIAWVEVQGLPGSNCYCDDEAYAKLQEKIKEFPAEGIHFIDSGNYHYMSRIWLEKIQEPFRLLVFDNHTDMQPPAFGGILSCGGWIQAAIEEVKFLKEVVLVGPDEEAFLQIKSDENNGGYTGERDADIQESRTKVRFLSREKLAGSTVEENMRFMEEIPVDLPLYISVDKDVLCREDACTAWSQGDMRLEELLVYLESVLKRFREKGQRVLGADICGECDAAQGMSSQANDRANRALLKLFGGYHF